MAGKVDDLGPIAGIPSLLEVARQTPPQERYDTVLVDEAQDLTPRLSLALFVELWAHRRKRSI